MAVVIALASSVVSSAEGSTSICVEVDSVIGPVFIPFQPHTVPLRCRPLPSLSARWPFAVVYHAEPEDSQPLVVAVGCCGCVCVSGVSRCEMGSDLEPSAILTCQGCVPDSK